MASPTQSARGGADPRGMALLFPMTAVFLRPYLALMRPRHWVKNTFLFFAPLYGGQIFNPALYPDLLWGTAGFCLASSAVYAFNDVQDAAWDRKHPTKRLRPVAAGAISPRAALGISALLGSLALLLCFGTSPGAALLAAVYMLWSLLYSTCLKRLPALDAVAVSLGFPLRAGAGSLLAQVENFSFWLYVCIFLMALLISFGKRHSELAAPGAELRPSLQRFSLSFATALVWIFSAALAVTYAYYALFADTRLAPLGLTIPWAWIPIAYYVKAVLVDQDGGNPIALLFRRPLLTGSIVAYFAVLIFILYVHPQPGALPF